MNIWLLVLGMILVPILIGSGVVCILYTNDHKEEFFIGDALVTGWIAVVGTAEAVHLCGVLLGLSFSLCVTLFGGITALLTAAAMAVSYLEKKRGNCRIWAEQKLSGLWLIPGILLLSQMIYVTYVALESAVYLRGDMTVETVESFLYTDGIYRVNPMTGMPYTAGIPFRLEILCLPTLYGCLCKIFDLQPQTVVWMVVPWIMLLCCYQAISCVGRGLFPGEQKPQACFLGVAGLLLWAGSYTLGMDGFGLLYSGWRGVVIRNGVLVPYLISAVLRRKWKLAALCVVAEACMVWTFYGAGVCLLMAVGLAVCRLMAARTAKSGREEAVK